VAAHAVMQAMLHDLAEVGTPPAEVVVRVDDGHTGAASATLQRRDTRCGGHRRLHERAPSGEFEIVDNVDQQQRHSAGIGNVAMQIVVLRRHVFFGSLVYYPPRTLTEQRLVSIAMKRGGRR
jgi:hypothetical protein